MEEQSEETESKKSSHRISVKTSKKSEPQPEVIEDYGDKI
jgi:hypothetical protein